MLKTMRNALKADQPNCVVYGCTAYWLNLPGQEITPTAIMKHITEIIQKHLAVYNVTGHFGQDPFRPEKTWTFRQKAWTIRPTNIDVSAKKMDVSAKYIFNSFNHRLNCVRSVGTLMYN